MSRDLSGFDFSPLEGAKKDKGEGNSSTYFSNYNLYPDFSDLCHSNSAKWIEGDILDVPNIKETVKETIKEVKQ